MRESASRGNKVFLGAGLALVAAGAGLTGFYFVGMRQAQATSNPATPAPAAIPVTTTVDASKGTELRAPLTAAITAYLAAPVTLSFDGKSIQTSWKDLGVAADDAGVQRAAARLAAAGKEPTIANLGGQVPVILDREKGLAAVVALKDQNDRLAVNARVDLDNRKVIAETPGFGVHVYESLAVIEEAARAGQPSAALAGANVDPPVTMAKLGNLDVSNVMGTFETHFSPSDRERNYNLRLASSHANGFIIMPGETFSFNDVVGDRTEKQGYHVAHVISAGEMVDGLAGGACQVSSTLHGAAWFAGLDLVSSRPHSRPSAYVTMGMDATVVYPTTDLKLKNPYDFPVVIHYIMSQGTMKVEILGKKRPWEKIAFERQITKEIPFETVSRDDDSMPIGATIIEQGGFPGYQLIRRRLFYKDGKVDKTEKWLIDYPPTTEYVRIGTNPDPNLPQPEQREIHGPAGPGGKTSRLEQ